MIIALPKRSAGLRIEQAPGAVLVQDTSRDYVHTLQPHAARVLETCDGTRTCDGIARTLSDELRVPVDDVAGEVAHLVALFADLALIESACVPTRGERLP